jgi:hypothetical protein
LCIGGWPPIAAGSRGRRPTANLTLPPAEGAWRNTQRCAGRWQR